MRETCISAFQSALHSGLILMRAHRSGVPSLAGCVQDASTAAARAGRGLSSGPENQNRSAYGASRRPWRPPSDRLLSINRTAVNGGQPRYVASSLASLHAPSVLPHALTTKLVFLSGQGPAHAGVIGIKCPRYTFFGDTVRPRPLWSWEHRSQANATHVSLHTSA